MVFADVNCNDPTHIPRLCVVQVNLFVEPDMRLVVVVPGQRTGRAVFGVRGGVVVGGA